MILNQDYDNVLSLIINSDSENKERIMGLINNMPHDLLKQLNQDIEIIRSGSKGEDITNIGNECLKDGKFLYWYFVNFNLYESVDIGVSLFDGDKYVRVFEMTLIYNSDRQLNGNEKLWLGKIEYNINEYKIDNKTYVESVEKEYQLVKNILGTFVLNYKNGSLSSINRVPLVNNNGSKFVKKMKKNKNS